VISNTTNVSPGGPAGELVDGPTINIRSGTNNLVATGNLSLNSLIASVDVTVPTGSTLTVNSGGLMFNGVSKWFKGGGSVQVPSGGRQLIVSSTNGDQVGFNDPNNGDNTIGVFLAPTVPSGTWKLRLASTTGVEVPYHAWIERDDNGQSTFAEPLDNSHTIGSISCGRQTIVVGSYDAHKPGTPLSWFSSAGPTRDGRPKPEVSAPGHNVVAASSRTSTGTTRMSGTSMASPAVTGTVALVLAEAARLGRSLTSDEIRAAVIDTARTDPPSGKEWDPRYGEGRVSASGAVGTITDG
jgi:subtilisin family serine protease